MKLRIPIQLKEWLTRQATGNRRSLSGEIVVRLDEARKREMSRAQKATAK